MHDVLDPLELLHLLGLEVLFVLRQLVNLLLMLEQLLCLLFLYLIEVAGQVLLGLRILLQYVGFVNALGLMDCCCLLGEFVPDGAFSDLNRVLHLRFLAEGPGLRRYLSLARCDLLVENLLGGQLRRALSRHQLRLPGRRRRDLESHVLACLADQLSASCVMRVLDALRRRKLC